MSCVTETNMIRSSEINMLFGKKKKQKKKKKQQQTKCSWQMHKNGLWLKIVLKLI